MSLVPQTQDARAVQPFEVPAPAKRRVSKAVARRAETHVLELVDDKFRMALTALRIDNGAILHGHAATWTKLFSDEQLALMATNPLAAARVGYLADQYAISAADISRTYMRGGR